MKNENYANEFNPKHHCDFCYYYTSKTSSWKKHLSSKRHLLNIGKNDNPPIIKTTKPHTNNIKTTKDESNDNKLFGENKKNRKNSEANHLEKSRKKEFTCKDCDYTTSTKKHWKQHLSTQKHLFVSKNRIRCKICNILILNRSMLWKHKKECQKHTHSTIEGKLFRENLQKSEKIDKNLQNQKLEKNAKKPVFSHQKTLKNVTIKENDKNVSDDNTEISNSDKVVELLGEIMKTNKILAESHQLLKEEMADIKTTNNYNYNNNITINMVLNNNCKDAMNLEDFISNMNISLEDLLYTKEKGFANGISNIFVKQLQNLQPNQRPIHCSDVNKLQFYVKDEDKWEEDVENKMDESIQKITKKQIKIIKEWEKQHPDYIDDDLLLAEWHTMIYNVMGGKTDKEIDKNTKQIKQKIGNCVPYTQISK